MSETQWRVVLARRAEKDIERLDPAVRKRVLQALERLNAGQGGELVRLKGRAESRLRVGDWRVIVEPDQRTGTIRVKRVLPRGRAYRR